MNFYFKTKNKYAIENFNDWIIPAATNLPEWFKKLDNNSGVGRDVSETLYEKYFLRMIPKIVRTAKTCSGITDLFKNSVLITAPCDIAIQIKDGMFFWEAANSVCGLNLSVPGTEQTGSFLEDNKAINVKVDTPFFLTPENGVVETMMINPRYHVNNRRFANMEALPGAPRFSSKFPLNLGVMLLIDKADSNFVIPYGHPLALLKFDRPVKVKPIYEENLITVLPRKKFTNIGSFNNDVNASKESSCPFTSLWRK